MQPIQRISKISKLHPLEIVSPLVLFAALLILSVPNYLEFVPNIVFKKTVRSIVGFLDKARTLSSGRNIVEVSFYPDEQVQRCVFYFTGLDAESRQELRLPKEVRFGHTRSVSPLAVAGVGSAKPAGSVGAITFSNRRITFYDGSVKGFPGVIYLHSAGGENVALEVAVTGETTVWEWSGASWIKGSRWAE